MESNKPKLVIRTSVGQYLWTVDCPPASVERLAKDLNAFFTASEIVLRLPNNFSLPLIAYAEKV